MGNGRRRSDMHRPVVSRAAYDRAWPAPARCFSWGEVRDQHRALACGERCPIPCYHTNFAFERRYRPLAAPGPIQCAGHRHRTCGGDVGLGVATGPAMHLAVDEYEQQVHILARERLFGDRAFGLSEQGVELAFEVFEFARVRRIRLFQQGADALGEFVERSPDIARHGSVDQRMQYLTPVRDIHPSEVGGGVSHEEETLGRKTDKNRHRKRIAHHILGNSNIRPSVPITGFCHLPRQHKRC